MPTIHQTPDNPYYKDVLWSKPETKALAGKLLIIGGNVHSINAPNKAFMMALQQGAGEVKVALPDATKKLLRGASLPGIEYAESTPSGSFSTVANATLIGYASWANSVLFAGDTSKNSETAIMISNFLRTYSAPVVIVGDSLDTMAPHPQEVMQRSDTALIVTFAELQKIATAISWKVPLTFSMPTASLTEQLAALTIAYPVIIVLQHHEFIYVAMGGDVSATQLPTTPHEWRIPTATATSVWWMQHPERPFEAITTAISQITIQ